MKISVSAQIIINSNLLIDAVVANLRAVAILSEGITTKNTELNYLCVIVMSNTKQIHSCLFGLREREDDSASLTANALVFKGRKCGPSLH